MTTKAPTTAPATPSPRRLRNGELRALVARALANEPGAWQTPRAIARALDRSSGAVANACKKLTHDGHAVEQEAPRLAYRATGTTASVAASTLTPPSAASSGTATPPRRPATTAPVPRAATPVPRAATPPVTTPVAASAARATASAAPVKGAVTRPNGQTYHPRMLAGMPDVVALRKLRDAGIPALLWGPPGTGKTSVIEAAFPDLITIQGDGDTTVADFVGEYTQAPDGTFHWVPGPLVRAMREGRALLIDDATLIPPTVLAVVYPAMDGRQEITVKAHGGEIVRAQPGFYVVAGHNPGVHGAVLSDALASRFAVQIEVSSDYEIAKQLGIDPKLIKIARNLTTRRDRGDVGWAPQLRELIAAAKIAAVLGEDSAVANLIGVAPDDDRDVVATVARQVYGREFTPLALGARV